MKKLKNRIHLSTNKDAIQKTKQDYDTLMRLVNDVLSSFAKIGAGTIDSIEEVQQAIEMQGVDFLNSKLESFIGSDSLKVGRLSLKRENLANMLSIEDPEPFHLALANLIQHRARLALDFDFLIFESGKVIVDNKRLDLFLFEQNSIHISSQRGIMLHDQLQDLAKELNSINETLTLILPGHKLTLETFDRYINFNTWTPERASSYYVTPDMLKLLATVKDPPVQLSKKISSEDSETLVELLSVIPTI